MASFLLKMESKHLDFRELTESSTHQSLLVIGVGLGRTGTMSLRKALQILYGKPCYHMSEIILRHKDHLPKWIEIFKQCQKNSVENIDPNKLREIFTGYTMTDGNPACSVYEKLIEIYPNAKVILTTRDGRKWLESFRETIDQSLFKSESGPFRKLVENLIIGFGFKEMAALSMKCALGWDLDFSNDEAVIKAYETRNQEIQNRIPPERLLCFSVHEGWEPLCKFLNLPIPDEPFPWLNDREVMQNRLNTIKRLTMFVSWGLPALLIFGIGLSVNYLIRT